MALATQTVHKRIALFFDFDDTLAQDSYSSLLGSFGIEHNTFERECIQPLIDDGWERILARLYCIIQESQWRADVKITRDYLHDIGRKMDLFEGVDTMFDHIRERARAIVEDIEVEFYLLSSGIREIAEGTVIANQFTTSWGCQFHYDENGEIVFVKQLVTHPEKVRYVLQVSKGLTDNAGTGEPSDVYREVPYDDLHIPMDQIIYVGDGASDLPVFRLLNEQHGIAFAIFTGEKPRDWDYYQDVDDRQACGTLRRQTTAPAPNCSNRSPWPSRRSASKWPYTF